MPLFELEPRCIKYGNCDVKAVYYGNCKVRSNARVDFLIVGGGAGGGAFFDGARQCCGPGGGGGEVVLQCGTKIFNGFSVSVGSGGAWACGGGATVLSEGANNYTARGGCVSDNYANGGMSGSGCLGGNGQFISGKAGYGGGGGAGGRGGNGSNCGIGGNGGVGICGYGGGGGGGYYRGNYCPGKGCDGGGNGDGCNATGCGGGGGGRDGGVGGSGGGGIAKICYKADGSCGFRSATGGTKTLCNGYCVHTFTSNGTFTISL